MAKGDDPEGEWDFFVSYTQADRGWAEWIAWVLEEDGYRVLIQAWDFVPGSNWIQRMQDGVRDAARTVAVLSPDYLESVYGGAEWQAAWAQDPAGRDRRLLVVRVRECERPGLLAGVAGVDLFGVSEAVAREWLQGMVAAAISGRAKPAVMPDFPGGARAVAREPQFPGAILQAWRIPARNPNFTGRGTELEVIGRGLAAGPVAVVAVRGLGGVGKSQLVLEYAHRMRESGRYQMVGWVRADSPVTVAEDLTALAPGLGLPGDGPAGEVAAHVVAVLGSRSDWLLVFDNAQAPGNLAEALPVGGGHVLITSRNRGWSGIAQQVDLEVFSRAESVALLAQRTGRAEREAAAELAAELGDLPLALAQAAAYIDVHGITISTYLNLYRDPTIAQRLRDEGLESGEYPASVARTWLLHFDELRRQQPAAVELLRLCAFLDPDDIDLDVLAGAAREAGELLAAAMDDHLERVETVGALARASLIAIPADGHLRAHRLVQAVTRDQLNDDQAREWAQRALAVVAAVFPAEPQEHTNWPQCASLAPHVEAVTMHTETYADLAGQSARLLDKLGVYLGASAQYAAACAVQEHALALIEAVYGPNHPQVGQTLNHLGISQHHSGDLTAARASLERGLAIEVAAYGPNHLQVAATLSSLGNVQHQQGDLLAASTSHRRALAIRRAALGSNHPEVGLTLTNLGLVQRDLGDLQAARASQERALAILETAYGPNHPEVAKVLGNMANVQRRLGDYEAARVSLERALAIFETVHEPDHPEVAATLANLGLVRVSLGDPQTGRVELERALAISEAAFGPDHPQVATVLTGLGLAESALGEVENARAHLERAVAISKAVYGPDHGRVATLLNILSDIQRYSDDQ